MIAAVAIAPTIAAGSTSSFVVLTSIPICCWLLYVMNASVVEHIPIDDRISQYPDVCIF